MQLRIQPTEPAADEEARLAPPVRADRAELIARRARLTIEERLDLFEGLSRFAAWARSAKRIR